MFDAAVSNGTSSLALFGVVDTNNEVIPYNSTS